jgi:hypothetical protein
VLDDLLDLLDPERVAPVHEALCQVLVAGVVEQTEEEVDGARHLLLGG